MSWRAAVCYYVATQIAWALCFPDSKVSLFFPRTRFLLAVLLLVPTRHWWAYMLAAASAHFLATQQAHWPPLYALHCEAFDAVQKSRPRPGFASLSNLRSSRSRFVTRLSSFSLPW